MVQCYSDIFQTALGLYLYLYKSTFCCFLWDLWSNPWPLAWQACSVSTIICVWCFTTAMLRSTKSVLALLCSFWVRNYKCVVVQFWFKASHDAAIMAATESEVIEGCAGLEGWFPRSLSYITRKVVLGVGGRLLGSPIDYLGAHVAWQWTNPRVNKLRENKRNFSPSMISLPRCHSILETSDWLDTCTRLSFGLPTSSQIMTWRLLLSHECSALAYARFWLAFFL